MDDTLLRQIALELTEEVCRAPMSIVCHECQRTAVDHASESLEDFQTPLTVRHWALLPASFADIPRMINVTFESQHLPIKVCLDRLNSNGTKVTAYSNLCQETGSKAKAIRYSVKKICASEKSWSCHSLHFSVTVQPRKAGDLFSECTESGCLLPDQTKIVLTYNIDFHSPQDNAYPTLEERDSIRLPTVPQSPQSILKGLSVSCPKYVEAGHGQPLALSMDYFVDLLEKIEAAYPEQNLFDVAAMLLNWFTVNEFDMTDGRTVGRDLREQMALESWLNPWPRGLEDHQLPALNRSLLDEREMCALFFMLHHSFHESTDNGSMYTIERGVAQVSWEAPRIAVAVAKVLQGIVVGMIDRTGNVTDIWQADEAARDSLVPPIDPQLSATIGVVLAVSSVESLLHRYGGSIMGHEGSWTGETCPSAYRTRGKRHWCSYSLLRGAIDGLLLGKHARRVSSRGISLSQLLRFFYGVSGVPRSVPGAPGLSVCGRRELLYPYLRDGLLEGNVSHMARAYLLHRYGQDSHRLSLFVAAATDEFLQRLRRDLLRNPEFCDRYPPTSEQAECQTPGDIFIVMDADAYANDDWMKQQRRTVELLAQRLNIGKDSRRYLHVYVNKRDMDGALQVQLANETSPSTASCYALTANFSEIATDNEAGVFESLRSLVAKNHYGSIDQLAPSKTIVMFKFGHLRSAPQRLRALLPRVVGSKEESSSIIAIGNNFTSLRKMVRSEGRSGASVYDKVFLLPDDEDAVKEVATKIAEEACTAPAVLRCLECTEREIKKSFSFEGTVKENGVVYIVLSPEDYGGFENLRVKVQSIRGALKVCHQRSRFRHLKPQDCDTVSKNELMFRPTCKDNPCQPLYVAVVGTSEDCYSATKPSNSTCAPSAGLIKYQLTLSRVHKTLTI
ncbi:uncharacterized protein LOC144167624 [Haemaphysalis longicornis]